MFPDEIWVDKWLNPNEEEGDGCYWVVPYKHAVKYVKGGTTQPEQIDLTRDELARAIAKAMGDDFDSLPANKSDWVRTRGGEPFRDSNAPRQDDYLYAADELLEIYEMSKRTDEP